MDIQLYQVDAFAERAFAGNPAAVCPLDRPLDAGVMQKIALENNLSETAFVVPRAGAGEYDLRWFTPGAEVDGIPYSTQPTDAGYDPPAELTLYSAAWALDDRPRKMALLVLDMQESYRELVANAVPNCYRVLQVTVASRLTRPAPADKAQSG